MGCRSARLLFLRRDRFGFVVLHVTDTMAYTASATRVSCCPTSANRWC